MFTSAEQVLLGYTTRAAINAHPDRSQVVGLTKSVVNTQAALEKFKDLWPNAYELLNNSKFHIFVSFACDLVAVGHPVPTSGFYCGLAEPRAYDRGMQLQLTVSDDVPEDAVLDIIIHESRHIEDMATGRLSINQYAGEITWEGVVYKGIPMGLLVAKPDETRDATIARYVAAAHYYAQPWEARANEGLWQYEFPGVKAMIAEFGATWIEGWDANEVIAIMSGQEKLNVYKAVKSLLER